MYEYCMYVHVLYKYITRGWVERLSFLSAAKLKGGKEKGEKTFNFCLAAISRRFVFNIYIYI